MMKPHRYRNEYLGYGIIADFILCMTALICSYLVKIQTLNSSTATIIIIFALGIMIVLNILFIILHNKIIKKRP